MAAALTCVCKGARSSTHQVPMICPMFAGPLGQAAQADLMAASALIEDAFALAQLGFYTDPLPALQASTAVAASSAWLSGRGALLLGTPVLKGLAGLRSVLAANANCSAGGHPSLSCPCLSQSSVSSPFGTRCTGHAHESPCCWPVSNDTCMPTLYLYCGAATEPRRPPCAGLDAFTRTLTARSSRALQASANAALDGSEDTFSGRLQSVGLSWLCI